MNININGQVKNVPEGATLRDVVLKFAQRPELVLTELNGAIVDRAKWADASMASGDRVELVAFVGGG